MMVIAKQRAMMMVKAIHLTMVTQMLMATMMVIMTQTQTVTTRLKNLETKMVKGLD